MNVDTKATTVEIFFMLRAFVEAVEKSRFSTVVLNMLINRG